MNASHSSRDCGVLWCALTGIRTGVLGGLAMLAWFLLASALLRQPPWTIPNLLGTLVSEDLVLRRGFGQSSLVGLAALIVAAGLIGALFALATIRVHSRRRIFLLGMAVGLLAFYASNLLVFRRLGAVAWVYSSPRTLLVAHLLYGLALGLHPLRAAREPVTGSDAPAGSPPPESAGLG